MKAVNKVKVPRQNLPTPLSSFIGRERELTDIKKLLSSHRLVTLTGAGGSGKTRLSLKVAQGLVGEFEHGIWFVELASIFDPAFVPQTVASTLNIREQPGRPLMDVIANELSARDILLVLDNCEHLISACAQFAQLSLQACPGLKILATSREVLGITGEAAWVVPPLSLPRPQPWTDPASAHDALTLYEESESVELFVTRAQALSSDFRLTAENGAWIAEICRQLDGMPLAIELAAARVRSLSVRQIAQRLDDRFHLLTTGSRTASPRQQTLYATLDWSFALLPEKEQRLLRRLSIFAGGWTLEAAEDVCADEDLPRAEILDALTRLVDKSLIVVQERHSAPRYQLLETIRQFARERLVESDEDEKMRVPHSRFYLRLAEEAEPLLFGPEQELWFERLEIENDNARGALEWALEGHHAEVALRWVGALWFFWFIRDRYREGQEWLSRALAEPGAAGPGSARARALNAAGFTSWIRGDFAQARLLSEEALEIGSSLDDLVEIAMATRNLGLIASQERDYATARVLLEKSVALWRELGNTSQVGWALPFLADVVLYQGDLEQARSLYEESAALMRGQNDKIVLAYPLRRMASLALQSGDYEQATGLCQESLALNLQLGDRRGVAACLVGLAAVAVARGQIPEAARLFAAVDLQLHTMGITLYPADQIEYERHVAFVREQQRDVTVSTAWEEGNRMTLEQVIANALETPPEHTERQLVKERFSGLTAREREVAALIAQGKSNREIAETMTVGVKTIETYVTRILNKLGFDSRVQIATWAVEKGLKQQ